MSERKEQMACLTCGGEVVLDHDHWVHKNSTWNAEAPWGHQPVAVKVHLPPDPPPIMVCQICNRVLDFYQVLNNPAASEWRHTSQDEHDHTPVPVLMATSNVIPRCDFCNVDVTRETEWTVPTKTFEMPYPKYWNGPAQFSEGDWCACNDCAGYILLDDWDGLLKKISMGETADAAVLQPLYVKIRENVTAAPYQVWSV